VLWGWLGDELTADELAGVERVRSRIGGELGASLAGLVNEIEIEALAERCDRLVREARFPAPHGHMPAVPWPLF
jgi:hypothetical protein